MNVWEAIVHMIKAQGVEFVFAIGDTELQLFAEKVPGVTPINLRYEGSAPFMAMAYSRLSDKPNYQKGEMLPAQVLQIKLYQKESVQNGVLSNLGIPRLHAMIENDDNI